MGRERYLLGQLCWAWAVISLGQNTENKFCRRKDTSVLRPALHITFHSLRQGRHVPRANNERRVLELEAAPQVLEREVSLGAGTGENFPVSCP